MTTGGDAPGSNLINAVDSAVEDVGCYSGLYHAEARVFAPATLEELRAVLAFARRDGHRVTFRAGGHAFDGQAINDDVVISMLRFDAIEVHASERRLRVGPGARWGDILARLQPHGLVPAVTVTTAHATAGGTLSGDCLSRFSPAYGKEGKHVESFDLMTVDGTILHCTPPPKGTPYASWTLEQRAFAGVIGGLGYLGAVVSITYRVLFVGETDGKIGVRTIVRKYRSFDDLARYLVPTTKKTHEEESDPRDPTKLDALYSAIFTDKHGQPFALFFTSAFTTSPDRRRMAVNEPDLAARPFVEWAMRVSWLSNALWPVYFDRVYQDGEEYIDDLEGFTFFMDGNLRAKEIAASLGFHLKTIQQTFIVPSDPGAAGGWDKTKDDLVEWLDYAAKFFRDRGLSPTLEDVLYLPRDDRFLLSAGADLAGFACSYAFETSDAETLAKVKVVFSDLADVLWSKFGGRVYLVKNVCARVETLRTMYGKNLADFVALKKELDPGLMLRNDFLERTFGIP